MGDKTDLIEYETSELIDELRSRNLLLSVFSEEDFRGAIAEYVESATDFPDLDDETIKNVAGNFIFTFGDQVVDSMNQGGHTAIDSLISLEGRDIAESFTNGSSLKTSPS